jgi:hypothetical protein
MKAKGSDSTTFIVFKKLKIQEGASAAGKTTQNILPSCLAFVAMSKLNMRVLERKGVRIKLLETDDDMTGCKLGPESN